MKAAAFLKCGGPENIRLMDVPDPSTGAGEVSVKVRFCGLNHFDILVLNGPADEEFRFPFWGGADIVGIVRETGEGVDSFHPGDRVVINPGLSCGTCEFCTMGEESMCVEYGIIGDDVPGGCAERIVVKEKNLIHLPDHVDFETAVAVPLVFPTALRALKSRGRLRAGEEILILGAGGGVASAAIQIAKFLGARVLAVTSSEAKMEKAARLGADICINRSKESWQERVEEETDGRGVDVVLDSTGAQTWAPALECLVNGGRLVTIGRTTGQFANTDIRLVFWNQLEIIGSTMASRNEFSEAMRLVFEGRFKPVIDSVFPLADAGAAYERLQKAEQFGKILLKI